MELLTLEVTIERKFDTEEIFLHFDNDANFPKIVLSEQTTNDLRVFFNMIFDYIIEYEKMIEFKLIDATNDMFKEVAEDIITQLNSELKQSEENFKEFVKLKKK